MIPLDWGTEPRREERWREEAGFFDAHAPGSTAALAPEVIARYRRAAHPWFQKEWRFRLLGPLAGAEVLDVGSGFGDNAILLASAGARVTGVDVSPRSVEIATARAAASGVGDRTRFVCSPVETADLPERGFDVVWGDGVLHHLIPELDAVLDRFTRLARPGARFLFQEPVNRLPILRRLRLALPIETEHTPGERPLEEAELTMIRRHVPDLALRSFDLFARVNRWIVPRGLETAPLARRALAHAACLADFALLAAAPLGRAGGRAVLHGHFSA
jgi:SAM-dependent methyltransferase